MNPKVLIVLATIVVTLLVARIGLEVRRRYEPLVATPRMEQVFATANARIDQLQATLQAVQTSLPAKR